MITLGDQVKDKVSGLIGTAVSRIEYLNGCVQYGICPKIKKATDEIQTWNINEIDSDIQDDEELIEIMQQWSCSDGFEYGIYDGGYVKPKDILVGESLKEVQNAINVLDKFRDLWHKISIEF